ncbi:flagellin [Psychromonas sp. 14N.309.X.WAT.B.A12]|uniref:flagellin N-terminal helical domain-containing protein n=1 Tax=unclassified Psychromonas TaxID=2614957 RepID=UPI0025B096E6|nr:flagellin [Psychromonas sp. 14N.309.X.WAT.B.A12]MDN2662879.1 flagellin [Psychromonas sp. 14N.309.X.WAT.B.A12]
MASVVNTNVMSLNAQRQLGKTQAASNQAMERLSSGLRINSAKDDAAGLAISTGMNSQIKGLTQAVRNSNDGISMAQTAEGAMDEMTNILQRMRELSVQSANDTNSSSNRQAIQEEVDQLHDELDRIANTTEFNGKKLLDGSAGTATLQIGANEGQTLSFSIDSVSTNDLGLNGGLNKGELNGGRVAAATTGTAGEMLVNGVDIPASESGSATDIAKAINLKTAETGVTASAYNVIQGSDESTTVTGVTNGMTIQVGTNSAIELGATSSMDSLVETINRDVSGVTASLGDNGELIMTNDTGEDITVGGGQGASTGVTDGTYTGYIALDSADDKAISVTGTATANAGFTVANGADAITGGVATTANITEADKLQINGVDIGPATLATDADVIAHINSYSDQTGVTISGTAAAGYQFSAEDGVGIEVTSSASTQAGRTAALTTLGMQSEMGGKVIDSLGTNVSTMNSASNTITKVDDALSKISSSRAGLGAIQNRLDSTISNLENVSQNLSASNSRIQDADFASETSNMSKAQILQQAGTSMLSQANSSAQSVLSLLG